MFANHFSQAERRRALELRAGQTAVCDRNVGVGPSMWRRWPVFTQALQPSGPVVARSALPGVRIPGGSRSQDCGSNRSSSSANLPSSTRSSAPPGASSNIVLFGAQRSIRTSSRPSRKRGISSTPGRPGAGVNGVAVVSSRTCVRSSGSNCQSLTKMTHPVADPGVWCDVGGLRMYDPAGKSPWSSGTHRQGPRTPRRRREYAERNGYAARTGRSRWRAPPHRRCDPAFVGPRL